MLERCAEKMQSMINITLPLPAYKTTTDQLESKQEVKNYVKAVVDDNRYMLRKC